MERILPSIRCLQRDSISVHLDNITRKEPLKLVGFVHRFVRFTFFIAIRRYLILETTT